MPTVPPDVIGQIAAMPNASATKKQWLTRAPTVCKVSKREFEIVQDLWFAEAWSESLYAGDTFVLGGDNMP